MPTLTDNKETQEGQSLLQQQKTKLYTKNLDNLQNAQLNHKRKDPNFNQNTIGPLSVTNDFKNKKGVKFQFLQSFRDLTLKSTILCLMVLSLVLIIVYAMIGEVYEIAHPEKFSASMKHKVKDFDINNRQENKIKEVNTLDSKPLGQSYSQRKQHDKQNSQNEVIKQKQKNSLEVVKQEKASIIDRAQQPAMEDKIKKQLLNEISSEPQRSEQAHETQNQQQQNIQLQQQNSKNNQQHLQQQQQSQLRQKEQFIENYQKQHLQSGKQIQVIVKGELNELNQKQQNNEKIEQKVQKDGQSEHKKSVQDINKPIVSHAKLQQVPHKNTPAKQTNKKLAKYQPIIPTAKAGITRQQAIKWRDYQQMIELPLQAPLQANRMLIQEYQYFQKKYNISQFNELPICVVVPTFNNVEDNRYQDNLKSILQQNYTNFHVVIIDDKSEDKTGEKINEYLINLDPKFQQKIKVIINEQRKMAMPNLRYAAVNQCQQNQLFIIVDGDDLLIGRQVFKLFSAVMQAQDYWVMWTNFLSPKGAIGYSRQYPAVHKKANNYRKAGFVMSHLRAYYTKLFRLIKDDDLKDQNGEYFHAANDVAIGVPILQMAHTHAGYVPEISYYYNMYTGLNNHKVRLRQQKANDKLIRKKQKYQALKSLDFTSHTGKNEQVILGNQKKTINLKTQNN